MVIIMDCFLCEQTNVEGSLEHSIPQFLGGKKSDDKFKRLNLCKQCNSRLGTHVDARFARSFIPAMELGHLNNELFFGRFTAIVFDENDPIHELIDENQYIDMWVNDVCNVFWLKQNTDNCLGLVGGHAPLSKSQSSKLFLFFTDDMAIDKMKLLLDSICRKFKEYKKLEILICVEFLDEHKQPASQDISYQKKIEIFFDEKKLKFIWNFNENELAIKERLLQQSQKQQNHFKFKTLIDLNDYVRFLSKLFLGVFCGYLGNDFVFHKVGKKLTEIIRTYSDNSKILREDIRRLKIHHNIEYFSECDAIVISIFKSGDDIIGCLSLNEFVISMQLCESADLSKEIKNKLNISSLGGGVVPEGILLKLKNGNDKYIEYSVQDFLIEQVIYNMGIADNQKEMIKNLIACHP